MIQTIIFILIIIAVLLFVYFGYNITDNIAQVFIGGRTRYKDLKTHPRSKSEAYVIDILEKITNKKFPTAYPQWLKWDGVRLELDGYNEKLRLGLEFSGPLHTKWSPALEPYEKYFERISRDYIKRQLAKASAVNLIVIDMSLPRIHTKNYILSRLIDFEMIDVDKKSIEYIPEQYATVYRNEHIERELDLKWPIIK